MLVREVIQDAKTGEVTERMVEIAGVMDEAAGKVVEAQAAQLVANAVTMDSQADQALAGLRAYRDMAAPTPAQTVTVVKLLCRVAIALIRFRLAKFDATD